MIGELLLYLMVTDLRELGDEDLRDFLELVVGYPPAPELEELQERALDQLEADVPARDELAAWPDEYPELLPPAMSGYPEAVEQFDAVLESVYEEEDVEDCERVVRFRTCLELLLDDSAWQQRAEAARGLGTLEEEMFQFRNGYAGRPMTLEECTPASVVAHRSLLEGFEVWQEAFRLAHRDDLEEALQVAVEGTCILRAVERWSPAQSAH